MLLGRLVRFYRKYPALCDNLSIFKKKINFNKKIMLGRNNVLKR